MQARPRQAGATCLVLKQVRQVLSAAHEVCKCRLQIDTHTSTRSELRVGTSTPRRPSHTLVSRPPAQPADACAKQLHPLPGQKTPHILFHAPSILPAQSGRRRLAPALPLGRSLHPFLSGPGRCTRPPHSPQPPPPIPFPTAPITPLLHPFHIIISTVRSLWPLSGRDIARVVRCCSCTCTVSAGHPGCFRMPHGSV